MNEEVVKIIEKAITGYEKSGIMLSENKATIIIRQLEKAGYTITKALITYDTPEVYLRKKQMKTDQYIQQAGRTCLKCDTCGGYSATNPCAHCGTIIVE